MLFNTGMAALHIGPCGADACRVSLARRANEDVGALNLMLLDEMLHRCLGIATGVEVGDDGSFHWILPCSDRKPLNRSGREGLRRAAKTCRHPAR